MTDEPKIEYAKIDEGHVAALLHIVKEAAGHTPKLSAIASEAMMELEAINADVAEFRAKRTKVKDEAEAKAKAEELAKAEEEAAAQVAAEEKAKGEADNKAKIDAVAKGKVANPTPDPVTGFNT